MIGFLNDPKTFFIVRLYKLLNLDADFTDFVSNMRKQFRIFVNNSMTHSFGTKNMIQEYLNLLDSVLD